MLKPVVQVCGEIGVSPRWLQLWCRGLGKCTPALPHKVGARGKFLVDPAVAYEHIRRHAARPPAGLRPPQGHEPEAVEALDLAALDLPTDPQEFLRRIFTQPELLQRMAPEQLKVAKALAAELRLGESAAARLSERIAPADQRKLTRSFVQLQIAVIEESAYADASELLSWVRREFNVDLVSLNSSAQPLAEAWLRERANATIEALGKEMEVKLQAARIAEDMR